MKRRHASVHELVIPTSFGHLCGAAAGLARRRRKYRGLADQRRKGQWMVVSLSRRGDVEPFHAMDVLAEANRLKALGHAGRFRWRSASRPIRRRPGARGSGDERLQTGASATPTRWALAGAARGDRGALRATITGSTCRPARIAVTTGSSAAFNLAFLAMFDPGDRVAIAAPGYPAYRNIMAALGSRSSRSSSRVHAYLHAEHLDGRASRKAAERRAVCQPRQSDRRHDPGRRARGARRNGARARHRA